MRLGDLPGGCDFGVQAEPDPRSTEDAVTVVLPARERVRFAVRLRAPRVAAVTVVVLGAGISIRLLRRPNGGGVRSGTTARHFAGAPAPRRGPLVLTRHRARISSQQGVGRQRGSVHRHSGQTRRARSAPPTTPMSGARAADPSSAPGSCPNCHLPADRSGRSRPPRCANQAPPTRHHATRPARPPTAPCPAKHQQRE